MSRWNRILTVAEMQGRDLGRRRVAMTLLVLLPAFFYYSIPADQDYGVLAAVVGIAWAVAAGGLFGALGWRQVDPRLSLAGARPADGLLGRLVLLLGLAAAMVGVFAPQILIRSGDLIGHGGALVLACALIGLVSLTLGLAVGALVPRELEGVLVIIGLVGVAMSLPVDAPVAPALPLYGPIRVLEVSVGRAETIPVTGVVHALASAVVLGTVGHLAWHARTRVRGGALAGAA